MKLQEFIQTNQVEFTENRIEKFQIRLLEMTLGVEIGEQLRTYLLDYGYLAYRYAELYGVNSVQFEESDMVRETLDLHKHFPASSKGIALYAEDDSDCYYFVDSADSIHRLSLADGKMEPLNKKLFDFILELFQEIA